MESDPSVAALPQDDRRDGMAMRPGHLTTGERRVLFRRFL